MIQSRRWRPEKKAEKKTCKASKNSHLHFLSSNSKVLKALPQPFPIEMKPTNCLAKKRKKRDKKRERRGKREEGRRESKKKSQDRCVTFKPKNYLEMLLWAHTQCSHQATALRDCTGTCYESCYELINN